MAEKDLSALVAENFGSRATEYVASAVHASGPDLVFLGDILKDRPGARLLDIGTGGGHVSYLAAGLGLSVTAFDLSADMLAAVGRTAAERGLASITTHQGRAEALPFADGSFDVVASRYSAHHWQDMPLVLREARRVLKAGGTAVFMDVLSPGSPLLDTHLQCVELLRDTSHVRDYAAAEWLGVLQDAGFVIRDLRLFRLRLDFASWVARMATPAPFSAAIRALQERAATDVRRHFAIEADGSFTVDTMAVVAGNSSA